MAATNQAPPPSKQLPTARSAAAATAAGSGGGAKSAPSSSLSSHFAMIELKQRILTSIAKLSDRDTHHLALADLHATVAGASPDSVPMLLNCLYDAAADPHSKPPVRKDALSLLALLAAARPDPVAAHLPRIVAAVVRRLKDPDSAVRDACRDALGALSAQYLRGGGGGGDGAGEASGAVSIFVKPLFEALNEQNKAVQSAAAACLAKVVECAHDPPVAAFQKLCPRICKCLHNPNFLGKASLLSVVSSLSQVGAIALQNLSLLMQGIHECLENPDWATRKAAAETLSSLASNLPNLVAECASSTIASLESCRFDKVKPVRDSMNEALQLWKKIAGRDGDGLDDDRKASQASNEKDSSNSGKHEMLKSNGTDSSSPPKNLPSPAFDSQTKAKGSSISDKTVGILKKKVPALSDKELNPDFFQKLETRGSDELPVEVVLPRGSLRSSQQQAAEEAEKKGADTNGDSNFNSTTQSEFDVTNGSAESTAELSSKLHDIDGYFQESKATEQRVFRGREFRSKGLDVDEGSDNNPRELAGNRPGFSKMDNQSDASFANQKGNWLAIQRHVALLERQQVNIMNMLQDFMGGSHDTMVTLENRVRGLERIVEDMARELTLSQGRRNTNFLGYEGPSGRQTNKYNGLSDYSSSKFGRVGDGMRAPFGERLLSSDGLRGRETSWRSDAPETWDSYNYGSVRNIMSNNRKGSNNSSDDLRLSKEHDGDQVGSRRAWEKGAGSVRLGEGPSARSVWQASKDEATLEAIRVAGEDKGASRTGPRVAVPELEAECVGDGNTNQERGPLWASWSSAMDSLHVGDVDSAYAELLSVGDDVLLMKLMDRTGPVVDQLSNEIAYEILQIIGQYLQDQSLLDIALPWVQQLTELVMENGAEFLAIPMEIKRDLLISLHDATSIDLPEDWEGATAEQLIVQLASSWRINLDELGK